MDIVLGSGKIGQSYLYWRNDELFQLPISYLATRDSWMNTELPAPDELQPVDVLPVDLVERTVAPAVERAPPVQPVGRIGVLQHRVGDRLDVAALGARHCTAEA